MNFEYELLDTGIFDDDRYSDVFVEYTKGSPEDILIRITVHNRGPEEAVLHILPTLWFRNACSWTQDAEKTSDEKSALQRASALLLLAMPNRGAPGL